MRSVLALVLIALVCSCRTTVRAYPVARDGERRAGIPFYMPKLVLHVREPVEVQRDEQLYAVLELGGLHRFLHRIDTSNIDESIAQLKHLTGMQKVESLIPSERKLSVRTEDSTTKKKTTVEGGKTTTDEDTRTIKSTLIPAPADLEGKSAPFYSPEDSAKAYAVITVPDLDAQYELVITPALFASSKVNVTLGDGWRLEGLTADTGENQLVKELSTLAGSIIGARKETRLAEIARDQALELARLAQAPAGQAPGPTEGLKALGGGAAVVTMRVIGYVKSIQVSTVVPGVYDLQRLVAGAELRRENTRYWQRISFPS